MNRSWQARLLTLLLRLHRSDKVFRKIFADADLTIIRREVQKGFPKGECIADCLRVAADSFDRSQSCSRSSHTFSDDANEGPLYLSSIKVHRKREQRTTRNDGIDSGGYANARECSGYKAVAEVCARLTSQCTFADKARPADSHRHETFVPFVKPLTVTTRSSPGIKSRALSLSLTSVSKARTKPLTARAVLMEMVPTVTSILTLRATAFSSGKVRYL